jgi:hypothetical protein
MNRFLLFIFTFYGVSLLAQPTGIYILDNSQGLHRDANIRDLPFVTGYVWRTGWDELETAEGVYDFIGLDYIVHRLDSIHQKLTLLFGAYSTEPAYFSAHSEVTTYTFINTLTNGSIIRAVPYDGYLLERYRAFVGALANHPVFSLDSQKMVPFIHHPVFANVSTNIPGLGAIRNVNNLNTSLQVSLPLYNRSQFTDSLVSSLSIQVNSFPNQQVFIPFYKNTTDNISTPALATTIRTRLLQTFDGITLPKIGFWQENLAAFKDSTTQQIVGLPTTTFATPLANLNDSAYAMFQMLQGWTTPFLDPSKTANTTPFDALCYAFQTYGSSYAEVYVSDIDNSHYRTAFTNWNSLTPCSQNTALPVAQTSKSRVFPNPASSQLYLSDDVIPIHIIAYSTMGKSYTLAFNQGTIDLSSIDDGYYVLRLESGTGIQYIPFIKQH